MKSSLISFTKTPVVSGLMRVLEALDREVPNLLRVLTYHRVDYPTSQPNLSPAMLSASPPIFEQHMDFIQKNYTPISMHDALDWQTKKLPPRAVLVTFDDAYRDFAEYAWPIARERGIPLTLFVPTSYPDNPERSFWWDELYNAIANTDRKNVSLNRSDFPLSSDSDRKNAFKLMREYVKSLPHDDAMEWVQEVCHLLGNPPSERNTVLSWDELRELASEGVTLGAHTRTHPMMNRISLQEARTEAVQSFQDLQAKIGDVPPIFAYPSGRFSDDVVQMLADEGFRLAFTTKRGINDLKTSNPLRLRRINIGRNTTLSILRGQLLASTRYLP